MDERDPALLALLNEQARAEEIQGRCLLETHG